MKRSVILGLLAVIAGVRLWMAGRPIEVPDGTIVKLAIGSTRIEIDEKYGRQMEYRSMKVPVPDRIDVLPGDRVRIIGKVVSRVKENMEIEKVLEIASFEALENEKSLFDGIYTFGLRLKEMVLAWLPGDSGALAAGIVFGSNTGMSFEAKSAFRKSGLSHLMAASGYNVTVVAGVVTAILAGWLGKRLAIPFGIVCICLYVILAGGSGAVMRAGIMTGLALTGKYLGRQTEAGWLLMLSVWAMLMFRPDWIRDVGFQLSVAATTGLLAAGGTSGELWWKQNLRITTAATIITTPLLLHYFGQMSVWAPVVNLMVLWCVPIIMEVMLTAIVAGGVFFPAGQAVSYLAWPLLAWVQGIAVWSENWPGNGWEVGKISWWWVGLYYATLAGIWLILKRRVVR